MTDTNRLPGVPKSEMIELDVVARRCSSAEAIPRKVGDCFALSGLQRHVSNSSLGTPRLPVTIVFPIHVDILYHLKIKRLVKSKSSISIIISFDKNIFGPK